jgi:type I restriction enzyme S subunit
VDFEFPDEDGKPYKSSGWEMEFCSELEMEVPNGWKLGKIKDFVIDMKNWATPLRENFEYWNSNDIPWIKTWEIHNNILISAEEYISEKWFKNSSTKLLPINTVLMAMYWVTAWQVWFLKFEATTNQACCAMICNNIYRASYLYYFLLSNQEEIASMANWWAQSNLSKNLIEELNIIFPKEVVLNNSRLPIIIDFWHKKTQENENLWKMKNLILSKMASES